MKIDAAPNGDQHDAGPEVFVVAQLRCSFESFNSVVEPECAKQISALPASYPRKRVSIEHLIFLDSGSLAIEVFPESNRRTTIM